MKTKILYTSLLDWYGWKLCCEDGNGGNLQFNSFYVYATGAPYINMEEYWYGGQQEKIKKYF